MSARCLTTHCYNISVMAEVIAFSLTLESCLFSEASFTLGKNALGLMLNVEFIHFTLKNGMEVGKREKENC